jgi:hypothetical protein
MRHVPPALAELTARAQTLSSAGDLAGARAVLDHALPSADTDPRHASPDLATAAALHARILSALGDPHAARIWAGFAHAAQERLHGPQDDRTLAAAATHAAVLSRVGSHGRAAQLYHDLVGRLVEREGRDSARVIAAEADLATAEHAAGQCTAARGRLAEAWARHRRVFGDAEPAGIKMLARLGAMERECGLAAQSREHLARAQELCARYLPADHPLAVQLGALAGASPSGRHTCGQVRRSDGPEPSPHHPRGVTGVPRQPAPGVTAVPHHTAPGATATPHLAPPGATAAPHPPVPMPEISGTDEGGEGNPTAAGPGTVPRPPAGGGPPPADHLPPPADHLPPRADHLPPPAPDVPPPDERPTDPRGGVYQAPLYLSDVHRSPGDLTGRHARADTPLPLPGRRVPRYTEDGRRPPVGSAPVERDEAEHLLPVPLEAPAPRASRQGFVLAAVVVAGIGVAAAVVAATLPRDEAPAPPTAAATTPAATTPGATTPAATTPAAAAPAVPGAPTGVRLRDNRDSVSLTWTYPKGAEGPVLISGGRTGQDPRAFQQLPAGAADYVVYGLNEQSDYCFTVAVVYSTERIASSAPVCTRR